MTIYVNDSNRLVELDLGVVPTGDTIEVSIKVDGETVYSPNVVNYANGLFTFTMPFHLCNAETTYDVEWSFDYAEDGTTFQYKGIHPVEIVEPILPLRDIKKIHPQGTPDEIRRIEEAVRHIINAHTGQTFGRYVGTYDVQGNNTTLLQLPARLLKADKVNGANASVHFQVENDGWALRHFPWGVPPVKADYFGLHQHVGGVIHNPNGVKLGEFYRSMRYSVKGEWGWIEVPAPVREAAKLLINDYACGDNAYRDRYLTSMTAADWRIQFNAQAFAKTGNVRADQLLSDYVLKRGWAVI